MQFIERGTVSTPAGFRAAGVACGLKPTGNLDLALLISEREASAAGVFTKNRVKAAPVIVCQRALGENPGKVRAVAANAGVANACTGEKGLEDARATQECVAECVGCDASQVLVLSTGVIGMRLDMDKISTGVHEAAERLSSSGGLDAARAIMTTDTRPKHLAVKIELKGGAITIGAMAKGAGMIHPDMATLLAVISTDVAIRQDMLQDTLTQAVQRSFNRITIDGDTSTNDAVLALANGASGVELGGAADHAAFARGFDAVCLRLAHAIVRDGEGASKFIELSVSGAGDQAQALKVAQTIATSPLVKTAFAGGDPNWGRVLAAAGRSGIPFDPNRLELWIKSGEGPGLQLVRGGEAAPYSEERAQELFAGGEIELRLDLGQGEAAATVWTCDLTHEYVTINAAYRT